MQKTKMGGISPPVWVSLVDASIIEINMTSMHEKFFWAEVVNYLVSF